MELFVVLLTVLSISDVCSTPDVVVYTEQTLGDNVGSNTTPYWNYLHFPRLTFSGTFRTDVSTINNNYLHFDSEHFVQNYTFQTNENWNPKGSGEWSVNATVNSVCYLDGECVTSNEDDKMVGQNFKDGGYKTSGKLVDLDTQAQMFSQIWGWRVQIQNFLSADFTPVPFQFLWNKMHGTGGDHGLGSAYQSTLTNITWMGSANESKLYGQLQSMMQNDSNIKNDTLSIRFNVDMYVGDSKQENFTYGRIVGSIGLMGKRSPQFFTQGRFLRSQSSFSQDAPFIISKRKLIIDFGNSLPITTLGSFRTGFMDKLHVGIALKKDKKPHCGGEFSWLGVVFNDFPKWYETTGGIQYFPSSGSLSDEDMERVKDHPLVVAQVKGVWPQIVCSEIVLAEAVHGIEVHPFNEWALRKNPKEETVIKMLATRFGEPLAGHSVVLEQSMCTGLFAPGPDVSKPPLTFTHKETTDSDGIAIFVITPQDPGNPRKFIDGQLYPLLYYVESHQPDFDKLCNTNPLALLNHIFIILVWNQYIPKQSTITWLDDIFPIFLQYSQLYPVMKNFLDLGNYYDVVAHKDAIIMAMELPISHPNYMPVTRDLSSSKRDVILRWLKDEHNPAGNFDSFYSVANLRKDLQTAVEIEHATIPPYLTALASVKYNYNSEVRAILEQIIVQEMMHLTLAANILNAIGGKPVLFSENFLPKYPTSLPGGVRPDLVVPIQKLSINIIRNVFMKIEEPEITLDDKSPSTLNFIHRARRGKSSLENKEQACPTSSIPATKMRGLAPAQSGVDEEPSNCIKKLSVVDFMTRHLIIPRRGITGIPETSKEVPEGKEKYPFDYHRHHNTIGAFYTHILNALGYLTDCGKNNSIFTGDPARQVKFWHYNGTIVEVKDFKSAVEAIKIILEQGEGSSPCNPMYWSNGTSKELSHYFLFYSIAERRKIVVNPKDSKKQEKGKRIDYSKICNGTYSFTGSEIPLDPDAIWPMVSNPQLSKYQPGSRAYIYANQFNKAYTKLLKSLHEVFNGNPDHIDDALGLMYSVDLHLKNLVSTPIHPHGDPDIGPNAGPTFDFMP